MCSRPAFSPPYTLAWCPATTEPFGDSSLRSRRNALNFQAVLPGENAGDQGVAFQRKRRLTINMETAGRLGISPRFDVLSTATLLNEDTVAEGRRWSLSSVAKEALQANLSIRTGMAGLAADAEAEVVARSRPRPQVGTSLGVTQLNDDAAAVLAGGSAERTSTVQLQVSQLLYSESARAAVEVERHRQQARVAAQRALELDVVQSATTGFLQVLKAQTAVDIRRRALELARTNLDLARDRVQLGSSSASDVYRWESEVASARRALLTTRASREQAMDALNRLLHLDDVAKVTLQGVQEEEIFVEHNMARLREIGLSPRQLSAILSGINIVRGGGQVVSERERIALEPSGNFESIDDLRRTVIQIPGGSTVVNWSAWIGQSAPRYTLGLNPGSSDPGVVNLLINTADHLVIPRTIARIQSYARERHPDLDVQLRKIENGVPIAYPVEVRAGGEDIDRLYELIAPIRDWLIAHPGVYSVKDDWGLRTKKLLINVDRERALRAGVTNDDVAISLKSSLSGIELSRLREADSLIPITMRSGLTDRADLDRLRTMPVYAPDGGTVPLEQVADIELAWQPAIIKRRDRNRTVAVQARLQPGVTAAEVNREFLPWLEEQTASWPRGYDHEVGGEAETSGNANAAIADKLPVAAMIILLLLVTQFNSLRKPFIILLTIPLGLVGVAYGLLIAGSVFGFFTILGLIALSGIVINNAIVLLDRIDIEIERNGLAPAEAVPVACRQRLRPILLTTATTIGGMTPLWLSHDPMFETMAVTIMFGLLFATLLTLLFIPVVYTIFFRVRAAV